MGGSRNQTLTRQITTFRAVESPGGTRLFRREQETHRLRLFDRRAISADLRKAGFRVRVLSGYGPFKFPPGYVGMLGRKR